MCVEMNENHSALVAKADKRILDDKRVYPDSIREYDMTPELCM